MSFLLLLSLVAIARWDASRVSQEAPRPVGAAGFGGGGCVPLRMALMIASRCASCALLKCSGSKPVTRGSLEPSRKGGGVGRMPILISCFSSGAVSPVFCFFSGGGLASGFLA